MSAVVDAIYFSAKKISELPNKDKSQKFALILLSDGEDRDSLHTQKELVDLLRENDIKFYSIAFVGELTVGAMRDKSKNFLFNLANETGGNLYPLEKQNPSQKDIEKATKALLYELRSQFVINYISTNQKRNGKQRQLSVQISDNEKGEKRFGIIREGFTVPKK